MAIRLLIVTAAALSVLINLSVIADELEEPAPAGNVSDDRATPSVRAYPRNVYQVDDVGLIIGGASEDAKAKVGRLRIQD